jgi:hypothetical protein
MSRAYLALYLLSLVVRRRNDRIVDSREFIDRNELELALEQLEALGALNNCRGGFGVKVVGPLALRKLSI